MIFLYNLFGSGAFYPMFLIFIGLIGLSAKMVSYQLSPEEMGSESAEQRRYNIFWESKSKRIEDKRWLKNGEKPIEKNSK